MVAAAAGDARKSMRLFATAGWADAAPTPAEKIVTS
jgi:hypothetical protein